MKNIFKVTIKLPNDEQEVFFDDQNRAEKFINAMRQIMTDKGNKEVEFVPELIGCIDCDEDIISAYSSTMANEA